MRRIALIAVSALAGCVLAAAAPVRDWTAMASTTKAGSYVIGNPAAKTKIVEYLSYTCSHCADFAQEGSPILKRDYVARGRASIEVRHAVRDRMDLAAALLARCEGPARFLSNSEAIFAAQGDWMTKGIFYESGNAKQLAEMNLNQRLTTLARETGLTALMQTRGLTPQRANACLSSKPQQDLLTAQASEAWDKRKIPGTPAFFLNGVLVPQTATWSALKPKLDAALN